MSYGERTNKDARVPRFRKHAHLLPQCKADPFREYVVVIHGDLLEQAAVNGDERPQRGTAIRVHEREKFGSGAVEFAGTGSLKSEERLPILRLFGRGRSAAVGN